MKSLAKDHSFPGIRRQYLFHIGRVLAALGRHGNAVEAVCCHNRDDVRISELRAGLDMLADNHGIRRAYEDEQAAERQHDQRQPEQRAPCKPREKPGLCERFCGFGWHKWKLVVRIKKGGGLRGQNRCTRCGVWGKSIPQRAEEGT